MNERIRKLAEQAGLEFDDDLTLESEPIYYVTQTDVYKFAELIVRECALVANLHNEEAEGVNLGVGKVIKEHFGVE